MAIVSSDLTYYKKNTLRGLSAWTILDHATISGDDITIEAGGLAGCVMSKDYNSALKASKYRKLKLEVVLDPDDLGELNYKNLVDVFIKCVYINPDGGYIKQMSVVSLTRRKSNWDSETNTLKMTRVVGFENLELDSCTVYVRNNLDENSITVTKCGLYRSKDVSADQVGESIGFGIVLDKVIAYTNGCELYYTSNPTPDKLYWMEDSDHNFSGIDVNHDRMIAFERRNITLD